MNVSSKSIKAI
ncbi:hypothetical protein EC82524_4362A, partial [Escherichia coli 8.2524]